MKRLFFVIVLSLQNFLFCQEYPVLFKNTEFFIGLNHSWFPKSLAPDFTGKAGFDFGFKKSFKPDQNIHFVLGLESGFSNYFYKYYSVSNSSYTKYYTGAAISKMMISTSFDFRFYFSSTRHFFIESGPYLDFNVFKELKATLHEQNKEDIVVREPVKSLPLNLGFNLGFGLNLPIKNYCLTIKPDLKWNLLPQMLPDQRAFDNITYMRLLLIIKRN